MREINTQEGVLLATNIIILFSFCLPFTLTSPSTLLSRAQGDAIPLTLNFRPSIGSRRHTEKQFDHVRTQSLYKYTYTRDLIGVSYLDIFILYHWRNVNRHNTRNR